MRRCGRDVARGRPDCECVVSARQRVSLRTVSRRIRGGKKRTRTFNSGKPPSIFLSQTRSHPLQLSCLSVSTPPSFLSSQTRKRPPVSGAFLGRRVIALIPGEAPTSADGGKVRKSSVWTQTARCSPAKRRLALSGGGRERERTNSGTGHRTRQPLLVAPPEVHPRSVQVERRSRGRGQGREVQRLLRGRREAGATLLWLLRSHSLHMCSSWLVGRGCRCYLMTVMRRSRGERAGEELG